LPEIRLMQIMKKKVDNHLTSQVSFKWFVKNENWYVKSLGLESNTSEGHEFLTLLNSI